MLAFLNPLQALVIQEEQEASDQVPPVSVWDMGSEGEKNCNECTYVQSIAMQATKEDKRVVTMCEGHLGAC